MKYYEIRQIRKFNSTVKKLEVGDRMYIMGRNYDYADLCERVRRLNQSGKKQYWLLLDCLGDVLDRKR